MRMDIYSIYPKNGKVIKSVVQLHARGKSLHIDLRMDIGVSNLIGWTIAAQRPGEIEYPIKDYKELKTYIDGYSIEDGNKYIKPMSNRLYTIPKSAHSKRWIDFEGVIEPGGAGSTRYEDGVFAIIDRPTIEVGLQLNDYHEYFLTNSSIGLNGRLVFREIKGSSVNINLRLPGERRELANAGHSSDDKMWSCIFAQSLLPSVIKSTDEEMPLDGFSALPDSLEICIPDQYNYWLSTGSNAKRIRDELVGKRIFTGDNIIMDNGEIRYTGKYIDEKDSITSPDLSGGGMKEPARYPGSFIDDDDKPVVSVRVTESEFAKVINNDNCAIVRPTYCDDIHLNKVALVVGNRIVATAVFGKMFSITENDLSVIEEYVASPVSKWANRQLYGYRVVKVSKLDHPIIVDIQTESWIATYSIRKIEHIDKYDPVNITDKELKDDLDIAINWFLSWSDKSDSVRFTRAEILSTIISIVEEMISRGPEVVTFDFESMRPEYVAALNAAIRFGNVVIPNEMIHTKSVPGIKIWKRNEERIIGAAVLIPGVPDLQKDIYDGPTCREAAYYFMENYLQDRNNGLDVMHNGVVVPNALRVVQSYVLDEETSYDVDVTIASDNHLSRKRTKLTYPKDTWIMYARVLDDKLWNRIKSGELTGWSIEGLAKVRDLKSKEQVE